MKTIRKIGALVLAIMMIAAAGLAYAAEIGGDGETGTWGGHDFPTDHETVDSGKTITIKKDLVVFNPNSHDASSNPVYAPEYSYVYTVTPATVANTYTVTDATSDHASGTAVTASVKAGITTGLVVNGGAAGSADSAVGYLDLSNATTLSASSAGATNTLGFTLAFTNVSFTQPGIYRYQIVEGIIGADHSTAKTYDQVAVADGSSNTRYLDVYVDGNLAIYGYVCMSENNANVTTSTTKTNGFVVASNGHDRYYTYDLTLSKDVVNDSYAASNTVFPFTVIFRNTENYATTYKIGQTVGTGSTGLNSNAATLTGNPTAWSGVYLVKDGSTVTGTHTGDITLTGIPAGVDVDVFETNIAAGVTYIAETSVNGATSGAGYHKDNNVISGSTPGSAVAQTDANKTDAQSTKMSVDTPKIATVSSAQTVGITNTLLLISPTGVMLRVAPYIAMLVAGIALLVIFKVKRRKHVEEE